MIEWWSRQERRRQPPSRTINRHPKRLCFFEPALRKSLGLGGLFHDRAQAIFCFGYPDSGKTPYSKIHCLAAALSLESSLAFAASE